MGYIYSSKKDYYNAIRQYLKTLEIDPINYIAYANMSLSKFELGNHENSLADLNKSEEFFKKNKNGEFLSLFASDELKKVITIYESNNEHEKIEEIIGFLNKNNKKNESLLLRGILNFRKGDFYNAISNFLEVYEIDNQNKECILYLGKSKLALKDYTNALIDFKNYIKNRFYGHAKPTYFGTRLIETVQ